MPNKIIILEQNKGRLGNQLWNFASVFAYAQEKNIDLENYSFRDYREYFNFPISNKIIKLIFFNKFSRSKLFIKLRIYFKYVNYIKKKYKDNILYSQNKVFYLSPTINNDEKQKEDLEKFENSNGKIKYFSGWLFRNPKGLEKYHSEIVRHFKPKEKIIKYVDNLVSPIRKQYNHVVGVHIRGTDYKKLFENGKYYFNETEVRKILDEYLKFSNKENVIFLICSDDAIDESKFNNLNFKICKGNVAEDLMTLAATDCIIGANSTFGAWAAYYGNIPLIVFERGDIDWGYYKDKDMNQYFENKKCTLANF